MLCFQIRKPIEKLHWLNKEKSNDIRISECFNEYIIDVTDTLNITKHENISDISISVDPIINAISKYAQHPVFYSLESTPSLPNPSVLVRCIH